MVTPTTSLAVPQMMLETTPVFSSILQLVNWLVHVWTVVKQLDCGETHTRALTEFWPIVSMVTEQSACAWTTDTRLAERLMVRVRNCILDNWLL